MIVNLEGIVIRHTNYGEGSLILTVYTKEEGKVGIMARGAKKTRSRFTAVTQLFTNGLFVGYKGNGLVNLNYAEIVQSNHEIREDLFLTSYGVYFMELLDKVTLENERNPYLYHLLSSSLEQLKSGKDYEVIARLFEMKILSAAGYKPELSVCAQCGGTEGAIQFSIRHGGFICENCHETDPEAMEISPGTVKLLRLFQQMQMDQLGNINVKDSTKQQLSLIMRRFIEEYLGSTPKSRLFIDQLYKYDL